MPRLIFGFTADLTEEPSWRFDPAATGVDDLIEAWLRRIYSPYLKDFIDQYGGTARRMTCVWEVGNDKVTREIAFDHTFLTQAMETYAAYGWAALDTLNSTAVRTQHPATRRFVEMTLWIVSVGISRELVGIERRLMDVARQEWNNGQAKLQTYLQDFAPIGQGGYKFRHQFRDKKMGKQVFRLCAEYARQLRKFDRFQKAMDERNRKDRYNPKKPRDRTDAQEVWYELYAGPQREVYKTMARIVEELRDTAPAAVLVLGNLPSDMWKPIASEEGENYWNRARELDDEIYDTLAELSTRLRILEDSLEKPSQSWKLGLDLATPVPPQPGGPEAVVLTATFEAEPEDNRVMADLGLVQRLLGEVEEQRPVSWEHAVLKRYSLYLIAEVDKKKASKEAWQAFWGVAGWVAAALALLALLAVFPFGGAAAVAPTIVLLLGIINVAAVSLVVITLVVDLFYLFTEGKESEANKLREQMFKLGQSDPQALLEVGTVLQRNQELRAAMTTGLVLTLFQLAVAGKIKAVAVALELDGYLEDMETLFGAPVIYSE